MKEKVSISDINIPNNFQDIKTNYKITLYDKDTGEIVYSTDGHNKLNPNIGLRYWANTYGGTLTSHLQMNTTDYVAYEIPTGIYFYNSPDDPSTNHIAGPQRGVFLGGGEINYSNSSANRCSYNPTESNYEIVFEDGVAYKHSHIVMDATTSQLNGEINSVVLGANRYLAVNGVFAANLYLRTSVDTSATVYAHNRPLYGKNTSLMSYHPDRPAWLTNQTADSYVYGAWSFESDNTAWFAPYRKGVIQSTDDIVLFHYDLKNWKVLETIKLSLPQGCIGKEYVAYKFDDCIGVYYKYSSSYSEDSSGNPNFGSTNTYIFNLNGDYVKSVGRSLYSLDQTRLVAIDNKLYYLPTTNNYNLYALIVFDPELNVLDGVRMKDYMNDSRFGTSSTYGKYAYQTRMIIILDNITGERRLLLSGSGVNNTNYVGPTNLSWDITKGQVEWLSENSIYNYYYNYSPFGASNRILAIIDGKPDALSADGSASSYWPFMWHHWCKLPSPVTKTANTTMKIQIDLYYPLVSPFAFAAPPETQASSTES